MVTTRARAAGRASFAEEKKDEDDYSHYVKENRPWPQSTTEAQDPLQKKNVSLANENSDVPTPPLKSKKSPLLLLLCASGITSCYLWYGTIQEHIFHMDKEENGEGGSGEQSITLFLLATGTFSSFLLAWIWTVIGPIFLSSDKRASRKGDTANVKAIVGKLNHPLIVLTSLTYLSAMAASNESLHYVSYPTCVLAKSSKLIPTMIVGWLFDQWRSRQRGDGCHHHNTKSINATEWIGAGLITVGILCFQYIQLHKQSSNGSSHHNGEKEAKGDSPYGLVLLGLSLFMDGLLAACQSNLKQKNVTMDASNDGISAYRPPSAMETMLYTNLYATLILLPASHYAGQFERGMAILLSNGSDRSLLLFQLNLSASLGQVFIFLTIHHFSPLTCTTITTTRKFFTILLSVYKFGHVLDVWQWVSVGLVFGGLYLEIAAKMVEQQHRDDDNSVSTGKKKME